MGLFTLHNCCVPSLSDYLMSQLESKVVFLFHSFRVITVSFSKKKTALHSCHLLIIFFRMVTHREDLVARGIQADALQPEWCNQNEGLCYLKID